MAGQPRIEQAWWTSAQYRSRPLPDILSSHDISSLFRFLTTRGWSQQSIAQVTGLDPNRVREILRGKRRVTSYHVLVRIAEGLQIERGLMGLAYRDAPVDMNPGRA